MTRGSYKWPSKLPGEATTRRSLLLQLIAASAWGQSKPRAETVAFDLSLLDEPLTHTDLFFLREHFPAPSVSVHGFRLLIGGAVEAPLELPYEDLLKEPSRVLTATVECAENPAGGGLVSTAEWTGASLGALLSRARPRPDAKFVRLTAADGFTRTIPRDKAAHPDTLVVWAMNGNRLTEAHGFPLRAVVPGWYGMDAVKWLRSIEATDREDPSDAYRRRVRSLLSGVRIAEPVRAIQVKSVFARPLDGAILTGRRFILRGAAWAGESQVERVEVSTDGGKSWAAARLAAAPPYTWALWDHAWKIPGPGEHQLAVRARDSQGREQPAERDASRVDDYEWNAWQVIRVVVK